MSEIGDEMCQAEAAHHANRGPESLISRDVKYVHLYKKALAITKKSSNAAAPQDLADDAWLWAKGEGKTVKRCCGTLASERELCECVSESYSPVSKPESL